MCLGLRRETAALLNCRTGRTKSLDLSASRIDHVLFMRRKFHQTRRDHDYQLGVFRLDRRGRAHHRNLIESRLTVFRGSSLRRSVSGDDGGFVDSHPHILMNFLIIDHRNVVQHGASQAAQSELQRQ